MRKIRGIVGIVLAGLVMTAFASGPASADTPENFVGNAAGRMCMSSTKSSIGHLLGAAGAVEAIFSILAMRDGVVPPTINLDNPSVETPIDLVPHHSKKRDIDVVLSNSFGFGGTNASLIFRRIVD